MRVNYYIDHQKRHEKLNQIKAILFCEFDVTLGPVIRYQHPNDYITKETFESLSVYLIPKSELHGKLITINAFGHKILGYPVSITDSKYKRNQLIFNLCLVFDDFSRTTQYEPIIQKLAHYLIDLEFEMAFISEKSNEMFEYFITIQEQLNNEGVSIIPICDSTTIHLKVAKVQPEPTRVDDCHVPVITNVETLSPNTIFMWDLTTQQIFDHIDGYKHVSRIAFEADCELNLVKACIQNLIYYGLVTLIPIFQYSNVYVTTPKICSLLENVALQQDCLKFVQKSNLTQTPTIKQVLSLYSNMSPGMTVKDLCLRFAPAQFGIDEQKLIKFGLMNGIIRRIQKYPILLDQDNAQTNEKFSHSDKKMLDSFDGKHSYDQICCDFQKSYNEVDEKVEKNPSVIVCWK